MRGHQRPRVRKEEREGGRRWTVEASGFCRVACRPPRLLLDEGAIKLCRIKTESKKEALCVFGPAQLDALLRSSHATSAFTCSKNSSEEEGWIPPRPRPNSALRFDFDSRTVLAKTVRSS